MPGYAWLSLTTDYGLSDGFVAACHGVVARIAPAVRVIDVSHLVPPGDVVRGATVLAQTVGHLPPAVHVAVVDPGVGTARRGVALGTPGGLLVGPDNGLLPRAASVLGGITEAVELTSAEWFPDPSRTFHGRDVFAPAAARFALGAPLTDAGPAVDPATLVRLAEPVVRRGEGWVEAEVLTVDHFGNVQLAAPGAALRHLGPVVRIGARRAVRGGTFGDAAAGEIVVYPDSADHLAVAVNGGRADELLRVAPGDVLRLE
ncbi:SAM-dependent chlorinase/fluorinase [Plantactinospora sp. KLBMP9567]|uniref:SAM hydrolase/SAM-dependent halogenase family protein n=1 Tax=Plantactinospora sp. KLBMP9567 TaxID=3085900 RepID=UPI00298109FF|nr:SAM-dependent chlorinase/fluorinase [Plantactinospora sp. KLBMP9567]MDW5323885.1 SAM-dependent chlorinase/fluorinase [Plantactinospora sp. KLBMP9567]